MARYAIAIDIDRCDGCGSCFLACKDEYVGNDYLPLSAAQPQHGQKWLRLNEIEQGTGSKIKMDYIPVMCQHCDNPLCAVNEPEGAVYKREDGIVIIDPEKAKGCRSMVNKCPYGAIFYNEITQLPQKCTLCAHRIDEGAAAPRCVEGCPTMAMHFGDLDDPESDICKFIAEKGDFEAFKPEFGTNPSILYRHLPLPFLAGEVMLAGSTECVAGAKVVCTCISCGKVRETETDFFGDFEFKYLPKSVEFEVTASYPGYKTATVKCNTRAARDLGVITLEKE